MPYLEPVPQSAMRFYRPVGMALLACFFAFPLTILIDFLVGPFGRDKIQYLVPAVAAVLFWPLMRYSRYRRERNAARVRSTEAKLAGDAGAVDYGPPGGGNLLVAGILALLLATMILWSLARGADVSARVLEGGYILATAGAAAVWLGVKRIRARRAWRRSRGQG